MDCGQKKERLRSENEGQEQKAGTNIDRLRRRVFTKWRDIMLPTTVFSLGRVEHEKVI